LVNPSFADRALVLGAFGRNLVRAISGGFLVFGWWLLLIAPRRALTLPILAAMGCLILTIGISVGGANSKYDLLFMPLLVIAATSIATEAARRLGSLLRPGSRSYDGRSAFDR
jgi:hypothetical protein